MKFHWILFIIGILLFSSCSNSDSDIPINPPQPSPSASVEVEQIALLGGSQNDSGKKIIHTQDGGFAIVGFTQSNDGNVNTKTNTSFDIWLLKYNANAVLQWTKTYGGSKTETANGLIQTQDGGFAIIGTSNSSDGDVSNNAGATDIWLLKTDANGTLLWERSYGFSGADSGTAILQTQDSGYFISGILDVTASGGAGNTSKSFHAGGDYWGIKTNAQGAIEWSHFYGGSFSDTPNAIIQSQTGGFLLVGASDSNDIDITNNKGMYDFWIVKISDSGNLLWEKNFGGTQAEEAFSVSKTNDGNYLILGQTRSNDQDISTQKGGSDLWLIKINDSGDLLWEKTLGGSNFDTGLRITSTLDDHFLITGNSRSSDGDLNTNKGQNDIWVLKVDNVGTVVWQQTIGGENMDLANDIIFGAENRIYVTGETQSNSGDINSNLGFSDLILITLKETK